MQGWENLKEKDTQFILNTYGERELAFEKGEGVYLWDVKGKRYLDFLSGIGVNILGYAHPRIIETIRKQASKLTHTSNLYLIPNQIKLAEKLVRNSFPGKCFFCNSGAEAVEASLKFARKWGKGRFEVISLENSFHGRTYGALSLTGQTKYQKDFVPLLPGIKYTPINDFGKLKSKVTPQTCAIIIEPIQGEGGVNPCEERFLKAVREFTKEKNILLIFDEVQCGMGRTGRLFAYQHFGVEPDVLVLAKGLGGGLPIGAMVVREEIADTFQPGDHASTFGGNPLSTAVACEVLDILTSGNFLEKVREKAVFLWELLEKLKGNMEGKIKKIKGIGFMAGIEISGSAKKVRKKCEEKGLLVGTAGENVVRLLPPLIVEKNHIEEAVMIIEESMKEVL